MLKFLPHEVLNMSPPREEEWGGHAGNKAVMGKQVWNHIPRDYSVQTIGFKFRVVPFASTSSTDQQTPIRFLK